MALTQARRSDGDDRFRGSFRFGKINNSVIETFIGLAESARSRNPIYIVVAAARDQLDDGADLTLPEGWTRDTIERFANAAGSYGNDVEITAHHANELAAIAREVLRIDMTRQKLGLNALDHIEWMIDVIETPYRGLV